MSTGIYDNLISQLDKLRRHNRQGSIKTKRSYYEAMKRFCRFLANEYRLEKLSNIAPKHLHAYVVHMQDIEYAASTVKSNLSAIRFWHDKISDPRHKLPANTAFDLERCVNGDKDRSWSHEEYTKMLAISNDKHRADYATALILAYYAGMRVEECFSIDTSMAEKALREGAITFHGKNGRWRTVPIDEIIVKQLRIMLSKVKRGSKLLTPNDVSVGNAIENFQRFIERHRDEIKETDSDPDKPDLTAHGLRHSYACRHYLRYREQGDTYEQACRKVSELLGHSDEVVSGFGAGRGRE